MNLSQAIIKKSLKRVDFDCFFVGVLDFSTKAKLGLKNLAILPSYFDYIFVHLRQKACLRPKLSPKFCQR